jgi:uncharacterized protein (TIGR02001 family)
MYPLFITLLGCAALAARPRCASGASGDAATVSANATLASQYISRGFRQTWGKPALQAGLDYAHPGGWSLGTWASTVSDRYIQDATVEWDIYGGYSGTVGELGYSVLAYYYKYPGAVYRATGVKYDYGELSLGLSYQMLYASTTAQSRRTSSASSMRAARATWMWARMSTWAMPGP